MSANINEAIRVAALLDQLKASPQWQEISAPTDEPPRNESVASLLSQLEPNVSLNQTRPEENRRTLSFRAALPILSELAEHESFLAAVKKIKDDQNSLERNLWAEREAIYSKFDDKFKTAQTKAQMIGASVSQYEIDILTDAFKKEIHHFDNGRAIPAWDRLVSKQQQELERMKVPAMFQTTLTQTRERQQQIIEVLENVAGLRT